MRRRSLAKLLLCVAATYLCFILIDYLAFPVDIEDDNLPYDPMLRVKEIWTERELQARKEEMMRVCDRKRQTGKPYTLKHHVKHRIFVDDERKFLYCAIPKAASTNWLSVILVLGQKVNTTDPLELESADIYSNYRLALKTLDKYSPYEVDYRLTNYFKFTFVRNPYHRLVSAYRNKFNSSYHSDSQHFKDIKKAIIDTARADTSNVETQISFEEFVRYLSDPRTNPKMFEEHWMTFNDLCQPCIVQYDAIGKFETLISDSTYLIKKISGGRSLKFPGSRESIYRTPTYMVVNDMFENMTAKQIGKLYRKYALDFHLFGYGPYDFRGTEEHYRRPKVVDMYDII